jgi:hypothetical protein
MHIMSCISLKRVEKGKALWVGLMQIFASKFTYSCKELHLSFSRG